MPALRVRSVLLAFLLTLAVPLGAMAEPVKNIVLVHGAWVDASGWKAVYEILSADGFEVSMVQEPETSFSDDVAATRRILDLQDGPVLLVGHSYGGSVITEAGVHPKVVGLVYVAAHAPDVGEDEGELGKKMPSVLGRTAGAIKETPDGFTWLDRPAYPRAVRARPAARASRVRIALPGARRGRGLSHAADRRRLEDQAELGNRRRRRPDHQPRPRALLLRARQEPRDGDRRRQPLGLRLAPQGGRRRHRRRGPPSRRRHRLRRGLRMPPAIAARPRIL